MAMDSLLQGIPFALLEPEARGDLLFAAERLPHAVSRWNVGFELRLQGPSQGDFYVGALPTSDDALILAEWLDDGASSSASARLGRALLRWREGRGWFARWCRFLLLEVDASQRVGDSLPPPALFLIPHADAFGPDPEGLVTALAELVDRPPDPAVVAELREMLALLPEQAELFTAGAMLSRPTAAAPRIAVGGLRALDIAPLLNGLGHRGAGGLLGPLASELEPCLSDLCLSFDIGPEGSGAVGLELYAGPPGDPSGWHALLERLARLDLADEDRARAAADLELAGRVDDRARLNHVKLTAVEDGLAPTKLYAVMHPAADVTSV